MSRTLLVGLDIGTTKVVTVISEITSDGILNVVGVGYCSSKGIDKGDITDLKLIISCVQQTIRQAEEMANCQVSSVYISFSDKSIYSQNEIGMIPIPAKEITMDDVNNVINIAKSVRIRDEHCILHVIPQEYIVDNHKKIKNPVGLSGIRMQVKVHIVICHNSAIQNITKIVSNCGLKIDQIIFSGLASSYAVLNENERELGVCLIDIGGGTMEIVMYAEGTLQHTKVIPYAGNLVTNDLSYAFGISQSDAELIKLHHGCILRDQDNEENNIIEIPNISRSSNVVHNQVLIDIIEPRYNELLSLINKEIVKIQKVLYQRGIKNNLAAGIVFTGGASKIRGLVDYAQNIFNTRVRVGQPLDVIGITDFIQSPFCSTVIGLLHHGKKIYFTNLSIEEHVSFSNWLKKISFWFRKTLGIK